MNEIRKILYTIAKILGDVNAVQKGKAGKRVARRIAGKQTQKAMNKFFK